MNPLPLLRSWRRRHGRKPPTRGRPEIPVDAAEVLIMEDVARGIAALEDMLLVDAMYRRIIGEEDDFDE
jgi:hypothetical protein